MATHPMGFGRPGWDEFDRLRRQMDRLLGAWEGAAAPAGVYPPVNVYETEDAFVLTAEVPGVRREDLEVSVEDRGVVLQGRRATEYPEDASAHRRERQAGSFRRVVELPTPVDAEKAEATCRCGVLLLRLPKPASHQPRRISVQAG